MCGIAGFVGFRNDPLIHKFSTWLQHRGPDGKGFFLTDEVTLLSRRLAIIDVKGGDQPIYSKDRSLVIVYNGEIYNYRELRIELEKKGHIFKTQSDTEVILQGYEEWGENSFDRLNGMFGVAIHDIKRNKTILARDHFGIKPLYFIRVKSNVKDQNSKAQPQSQSNNIVIFSSEIKPLIYSGLFPVEPNERIIYRYLKYRIHDDGRETFFKRVERLLPGEMMVIEGQKSEIKKYTDLESRLLKKSKITGFSPYEIASFRDLLIDSIRRRLVSEVPVGSCLSGGLDSSTVVGVVNQLLQEKLDETKSVGKIQKTFSAVFPGSSNDEDKYIDELVMKSIKSNVESHKIKPNSSDFFSDLKDFVKTQEEPTISTGPYAQYRVMQKAHEYVTVLLDGQGSDEMMAGYLPYYFVYFRQLIKEKKYGILFNEVISSWDIILKFLLIKKDKRTGIKNWMNEEFADKYKDEKFHIEDSHLKRRLHDDIFKNSLQSLLRYEDKNAMRFSIEGRVPFLDYRLLELIFSLPDMAVIKDGWNKYILRESTKDILPKLINQRRNKIGFTTPEYEWFKKESKQILDLFKGERFEAKKFVNQAEVVVRFQDFINGKTDDTLFFWRIMNLELWMREFFKNPTSNNHFPISKKIKNEIMIKGKSYWRYPIRTGLFKKGDNVAEKVADELDNALSQNISKLINKKWFVVISEKVVATAQGRAYFIWDIHPTFWAKLLSKFVSKVPWGIGLGSPWTMQLAIQEVGLIRILTASLVSALGKLVGVRGLFYRIAGRSAAGIDGPTEYSLYPANLSAKLLPKEPEKVCKEIDKQIISNFQVPISKQSPTTKLQNINNSKTTNYQLLTTNYLGSAIIDANDIGRNVLGNSSNLSNKLIEDIFADNPMGQSNEQTPITIVIEM